MAENFTVSPKETESKNKKSFGESFTIRILSQNAIVAALYIALTLILPVASFGPIQCRISEALVLLCFWRPDFILGFSVGCLISNIIGASLGIVSLWDILFGTLATLLSCLMISYLSKRLLIGCIWPVSLNALIIGMELHLLGYSAGLSVWFAILYVGIGEFAAIALGYALWMLVSRMTFFNKIVNPVKHNNIKW